MPHKCCTSMRLPSTQVSLKICMGEGCCMLPGRRIKIKIKQKPEASCSCIPGQRRRPAGRRNRAQCHARPTHINGPAHQLDSINNTLAHKLPATMKLSIVLLCVAASVLLVSTVSAREDDRHDSLVGQGCAKGEAGMRA